MTTSTSLFGYRLLTIATRFLRLMTASVVLVSFVTIGCGSPGSPQQPEPVRPPGSIVVADECPSITRNADAFPARLFGRPDIPISPTDSRIGQLLIAGGFAPLWCGDGPIEAYRLVWLPSFRAPLVVLATRTTTGWTLRAVVYEDPRKRLARQSEDLQVVHRVERNVSEDAGNDIVGWLRQVQFWTTATLATRGTIEDGVIAVIEGRLAGGYRVVARQNPNNELFGDAVRTFVQLVGIEIPTEMARTREWDRFVPAPVTP